MEAAEARPSLHMSKCHIVGNLMPQLIYSVLTKIADDCLCLNTPRLAYRFSLALTVCELRAFSLFHHIS